VALDLTNDINGDFILTIRRSLTNPTLGSAPFVDSILDTLLTAGILNVSISETAPTSNQANTIWLQPLASSWTGNGMVYMWNAASSAYVVATPALFAAYVVSQAPNATDTSRGVVQIGEGIGVTSGGTISLEPATNAALGAISVGTGLSISPAGVLALAIQVQPRGLTGDSPTDIIIAD